MKAVLLDTHAFLWFVFDDPRLSARAASVIEDAGIEKCISVAGLWEIVIKHQLGRLGLGMDVTAFLEEHVARRRLEIVPIELEHLVAYGGLPLLHRDPFDRILVAQARALDLPVVSSDPAFAAYGIPVIW
ncbi:MAG: type II toxin-antitoxin system VapC family toxin [Deltaproteobacteria bacterium]|nr:type II toxin-antitoxin system VapC family toxin [Deltaproteobacteria bacterium]